MTLKEQCKTIEFREMGDATGKLVAIEGGQTIPFDIKRVFFIYGMSRNSIRGKHANINTDMVLICLTGSVKITVRSRQDEYCVVLDSPGKGLLIPHMLWREMSDFSAGTIILVLANTYYNPEDYITDLNYYENSTYQP